MATLGTKLHDEPAKPDTLVGNTTDVMYQEVQVYIEGVQMPFSSCSISQAMGNLPSASISLPPSSGLMDIVRFYQPKVHIFYTDLAVGGQRLLFWGHIVGCDYSSSVNSTDMTFSCVHKNSIVNQVTADYSGYGSEATQQYANPNPSDSVIKPGMFTSQDSLIHALNGITGLQTDPKDLIGPVAKNAKVLEADSSKLDQTMAKFEKRFVGMPASVMNLWNQFKKECYAFEQYNKFFAKVYIPLLEEGIHFFDRMSGHYLLEKIIQDSKFDPCLTNANIKDGIGKVMLPPAFRLNSVSSIQTAMSVETIRSALGFSGQLTGFYQLFQEFFYSVEYEMLTLASPASVPANPEDTLTMGPGVEGMAVETIVKPQMPFYFSPVCNVILPNMYSSIRVSQSEQDVPSRISVIHSTAPDNSSATGLNYRAPHSIRESIALGIKVANGIFVDPNSKRSPDLQSTTGPSYNIPGKFEIGRGIHPKNIGAPSWLGLMVSDYKAASSSAVAEVWPTESSVEGKNLADLKAAWEDRYAKDPITGNIDTTKNTLNPYSPDSKILPYQRLLFAAADYDFTKSVMATRSGSVEGLFNPYIVPGYPMDILSKSPNRPSFHATCAAVTHTFTSSSISTSISFVAAMTYAEISNYQMYPVHPWLQTALKIVNVERSATKSTDAVTPVPTQTKEQIAAETARASLLKDNATAGATVATDIYGLVYDPKYDLNTGDVTAVYATLVNNPRAKAVADKFYYSVFGVGAVSPSDLVDLNTGVVLAQARKGGMLVNGSGNSIKTQTGGEGNDNLTGIGNMRLVSRLIESKQNLKDKYSMKFIDLTHENYTPSSSAYMDPALSQNATLLEPGASMFLSYPDIDTFIA